LLEDTLVSLEDPMSLTKPEPSCNLFLQMFHYLKKNVLDNILHPFSSDKKIMMSSFEKNLIFLKVILFIMLFIMSIYFLGNYGSLTYNNQTTTETQLKLFGESIVFGLSIAISFLIVVLIRLGSPSKFYCFYPVFGFIFVFFFLLNFLFEWSGFSTLTLLNEEPSLSTMVMSFFNPNQTNQTNQTNHQTLFDKFLNGFSLATKVVLITIIAIPIISVFILTPLCSVGKWFLNYDTYNIKPHWSFFIEILLFGLCGIIPTILMLKNRDQNISLTSEDSIITLSEMAAVMIYFHVIFQISGFYTFVGLV